MVNKNIPGSNCIWKETIHVSCLSSDFNHNLVDSVEMGEFTANNVSLAPTSDDVTSAKKSENCDVLTSECFPANRDVNYRDVSHILRQVRIDNVNNVIIAHLNVNHIANKLDVMKTIIPGNVDIMIFSETKLDSSYPTSQLLIHGFSKPYRKDRNCNGGGILIYIREDLPSKLVNKHMFPDDIEGLFIEVNLRKSKWLILGSYHPPSQRDEFYFDSIGRALDVYNAMYDKILLAGDFNAEEHETALKTFLQLYDLKNLVKDKTCFKSPHRPTCIDLFLTNCGKSFMHTKTISTGLSDCHKMILTVLKTTFKKAKPKEITYRCYKNFVENKFRSDLENKILTEDCKNYGKFEEMFLDCLNHHAPLKKRVVRANEVPYMTKALRKAIATRSRLENRYYRHKTAESKWVYKKQKNYVSRLYK